MATTSKAMELAKELADILKRRTGLVIAEGYDTSSEGPHNTILIGAGTTTTASAFIRIKPIEWSLSQNVIGQTSQVYTPCVIQLVTEARPSSSAADYISRQILANILGEIFNRAAKLEWYESDNGTGPAVGSIVAAKLKATFESSLNWGASAGQ